MFLFSKTKNLIIILLSALSPFIYSTSFLAIYNHLDKQQKNDSQTFVLDYLKNKYNGQDFIIENIVKTQNCNMFGCYSLKNNYTLTINSKYNKNFIIQVDIDKKEGYIRDAGSVYLIYTDSTPTTVNKCLYNHLFFHDNLLSIFYSVPLNIKVVSNYIKNTIDFVNIFGCIINSVGEKFLATLFSLKKTCSLIQCK